jgi:hypothetical protein
VATFFLCPLCGSILDTDALARATASDQAPVTVERDRVDADEHGRVGGSGSLTIAVG